MQVEYQCVIGVTCQDLAEQMIEAYHKGTVVYAYKGLINRNIDYNWSGAILLDFVKIVDKCKHDNGVQPAPNKWDGITLDIIILQIVTHITGLCQITLVSVAGKTVDCRKQFQVVVVMSK